MRTILVFFFVGLFHLLSLSQLVNNYDTCRTQMYYQKIGNSNNQTFIEKSRTVQDNGIISVGYTSQPGSQNALIIKQNSNGQVIWQKEYGTTEFDEKFTDWRELPNKQIFLGGIAKNKTTQQSVFFMMVVTPDGNIIWQKSFEDIASSSNINNVKVYPDFYGEYFFAVETDLAIIYGMAGNTGINWQRSLTIKTGTKLVAAVSFYSSLLITTNEFDSGYHSANFYYINYEDAGQPKIIKYTTKLGGFQQKANYMLHDYEQDDIYSYFSGIRSVQNGSYEIIRVNIDQGYIRQSLETILTPNVTIDSLSKTAINIYGDCVSFTSGRKNDHFNVIHLTGSENIPTNVIWASSYQLPESIVLKGNIKTWDNGYIFWGFNEFQGGNQNIIQLKVDSASLGPSCINKQNENFSVIRNPFPADTAQYAYNIQHLLTDYIYTASVINSVIDTIVLCKEIKCPILPLTDSCVESYQKLYTSYDPGMGSTGILIINDRIFISGMATPMNYNQEKKVSFISEINKNGQVLKQKKYVIGKGSFNTKMYKSKDNNLLLYDFTDDSTYYPSIFLSKIDTNLNVLWIKSLRLSSTPQYAGNLSINEVKQGSDGSYFFQYSDGITFGETRLYLTKLDINGNLIWSKIYRASYNIPNFYNNIKGTKLEVFGGNVYIMCTNGINDYCANVLLKVSENDGSLVWSKLISNTTNYVNLSNLMTVYNNELLLGGQFKNTIGYSNPQNIFVKLDLNGNLINMITYNNPTFNVSPIFANMNLINGNIYMSGSFYATPPISNPYQINITLNNNFDIITAKRRPSTLNSNSSGLALSSIGTLYETGAMVNGYNLYIPLYVIKFSPNGNVGTCPSDSFILEKNIPAAISISNIPCTQSDSLIAIRTPIYRVEQFFLATSKLVCASVPGCNSIKISGNNSICDKSIPYTFRALRNPGCNAPTQWLFDNSKTQLLNQTDSSVTIRFLATGSLWIKARFTSSCKEFIDSILVHVVGNNSPVLNLGGDTTLCSGANLLLNAKKGFKSYLWQDGSTDSTFKVKTGGLYFVTVTDSCNNIFSDSIRVSINGNSHLLNLGPDSNFCISNTILLNAHSGFTSYIWQDGSTDSVYIVSTPGLFYVKVTDVCGNQFSDSIIIKSFKKAALLNLGADKILCNNSGTIQLNAGVGFKSYNWQDGSTDSILTTKLAGLYFVKVIDSCGNVFSDSIWLKRDTSYALNIGSDTTICKSDSATIHVTTGLNNYLWTPQQSIISNGASAIVFPVIKTRYFVSAMTPNGCMESDSILINVFPSALINLGSDVNICAGDSIQLNAGNGFKSYKWSTGSQTASIKVSQVGLYYVAATDLNNCTVRDSFSILKLIPLPVSKLPLESSICYGQPKTLSAGSGFKNYLWSTGELTESISVSTLGIYWVTVQNSFGCIHTDSIQINKIFPSPSGMLKAKDSAICSFESITLTSPQNYKNYLWSNGSTNSSIIIKNEGIYWLEVTDSNGCIGRDSFRLTTKVCNEGVFFPNGFTPNADGKNDKYKPIVNGNIINFRFIIYNRYGEKVYESNNTNDEGWNGEFKGSKQETGGFVWQCWYQFYGEKTQHKSGSILLIH